MKMTQDPDGDELHQVAAMAANSLGLEAGDYREFVIAYATHKFCEHFHGGQGTNLYANMCNIGIRGDVKLDEEGEEIYNALVLHFTECDVARKINWNNRMRCCNALKALRAYASDRGERADDSHIGMLVTDLMFLKSLVESDALGPSKEAPLRLMENAFNDFEMEAYAKPSTMEDQAEKPVIESAGGQGELIAFLKEVGVEIIEEPKPRWKE